jgi:hypothetical protein
VALDGKIRRKVAWLYGQLVNGLDLISEEILHRHMWRYPEVFPIRSPGKIA